jgi:hypothetical protein
MPTKTYNCLVIVLCDEDKTFFNAFKDYTGSRLGNNFVFTVMTLKDFNDESYRRPNSYDMVNIFMH